MSGPIEQSITRKLSENLEPSYLTVANESHSHNVPQGSESHFKVVAASAAFDGKRAVQRHQLVYGLLKEELAGEVHALALHLYTVEEWQQASGAPASPQCMGGSKG